MISLVSPTPIKSHTEQNFFLYLQLPITNKMTVTVIENRGFEEKNRHLSTTTLAHNFTLVGLNGRRLLLKSPQTIPTTPDMRLALSKILSSQKGLLHMSALSLCKGR